MRETNAQKVDKDKTLEERASIGMDVDRSKAQVAKDMMDSINTVLVPDPDGPIKVKMPTFRDPEPPHRMQYQEIRYREIPVPHDEVLFYTHGVIQDRLASHATTVLIGNNRISHVFDRSYTWNGRIYHRCAWVPNKVERAGILYCKMISRTTRRPVAVLKKFQNTQEPQYQIVGGQEADYRDLRRIFERAFISRKLGADDDELDKFQYDAIVPIEAEMAG